MQSLVGADAAKGLATVGEKLRFWKSWIVLYLQLLAFAITAGAIGTAILFLLTMAPPELAEVYGSYRGDTPSGSALLIVRRDRTWEYRVENETFSGLWDDELYGTEQEAITLGSFPSDYVNSPRPNRWKGYHLVRPGWGKGGVPEICVSIEPDVCFARIGD